MKAKKWIAAGLKLLVSATLIWWLMTKIDIATAKAHMAMADPLIIGLSLIVLAVQMLIGGLRWQAVLRAIGTPLSLRITGRLFYIGTFFNQTLPSAVGGDAVRMYMAHREGLRGQHAVGSVMLERVVTVVALVVLVAAVQPWFLPKLDEATMMLAATTIGFLALGTIVGLAVLMMLDRLPASIAKWRVGGAILGLGGDARRVFLIPRFASVNLVYGILTHVNVSLFVYVIAMSMQIEVALVDCLVLMPLVVLVTTLPISIAGWGVRELAMVQAFGLVGMPAEAATALSIMVGLVVLVFALPGGVVWMMSRGNDTDAAAEFAASGGVDAAADGTDQTENRPTS